MTGPATGGRDSSDQWAIVAEGGEINLMLTYTTGKRSWSPGESTPYSAANPDFYRIYRYRQLVDLVMSEALGKPMTATFMLFSTIPELSGILGGSEKVVAVLDVPVYVREVFLP